jgi:glycosyltransferase involved in cell wall biosynthesis
VIPPDDIGAPALSVVLPAFNEAGNIEAMIADVFEALRATGLGAEVIVVDDGSSDETASIVTRIAAQSGMVRLLRHDVNQGYGGALFTGLSAARGRRVFLTDSDRQFDLSELPLLLAGLGPADIAAGYRAPRRDPFLRRFNGRGWNLVVRLLFGKTARDVDCAFKVFREEVLREILPLTRSRGATFSVEMLVLARRHGYRVREFRVRGHRPRCAGSPSGARPQVILQAFRDLVRFRLRLIRTPRPWAGPRAARTSPPA